MKVVISYGGSVLVPDKPNLELIRNLCDMIIKLDHRFWIVVGGGKVARDYINAARQLNAPDTYCDEIGIDISRVNARLLISSLGDLTHPEPALNFKEAYLYSVEKNIVVMGGTHPGHTTDAVAAMLGDYIKADLIVIATSVDGVYSKDPKKYPDAERYETLKASDLVGISMNSDMRAGYIGVVDPLAAKIIERSNIKTVILDGSDIDNLFKCLTKKKFRGTIIIPDKED
ncbi:MAG: UMP kinase [Candidatus Hydrothermarchaeota archaeon]